MKLNNYVKAVVVFKNNVFLNSISTLYVEKSFYNKTYKFRFNYKYIRKQQNIEYNDGHLFTCVVADVGKTSMCVAVTSRGVCRWDCMEA